MTEGNPGVFEGVDELMQAGGASTDFLFCIRNFQFQKHNDLNLND